MLQGIVLQEILVLLVELQVHKEHQQAADQLQQDRDLIYILSLDIG